ncbi:MAG TPA: START domain-containing protein [Mucilaginibacter sp.]
MWRAIITLFLSLAVSAAFAQTEWKLKNEKDGIKVYMASVPDSKFKAIKVECELNASAPQLVKVLMDIKAAPEWVDHTKSATLVKQISPSELYYYCEVNIPWPAKNRDFVAHLVVKQDPQTKVITVDGPAVPGFVPVKNGIVRISSSKGFWVITPVGENRVKVKYTLQVDPGGNIPAWLVNMLAADSPMKSFEALIIQLKKPVYQDAQLALN